MASRIPASSGHSRQSSAASALSSDRRADVLKLLLYDLNSAIAPEQHRILALDAVIRELTHNEEGLHDEELDLHADKILLQKLALALRVGKETEETAMVCTALELVFRSSKARVSLSFAEVREVLLPLLTDLLGKPRHLARQEYLHKDELPADSGDSRMSATADLTVPGSERKDSPSARDESYGDEKYDEGTYDDGTYDEATYEEGTYEERTFESGHSSPTFDSSTIESSPTFHSGPTRKATMAEDVETVMSDYESEYTQDHDGSHHVKQPNAYPLETVEEDSHEVSSRPSRRGSDPNAFRHASSMQRTERTDSSVTESTTSLTRDLRARLRERDAASASLPSLADDTWRVEPPSHPVAVSCALQILRYISRVLSAMVPLAHYPLVLDSLVYQLDVQPYGKYGHPEPTDSRNEAIAVLVNLACAEENKVKMIEQSGLLDAVLTMALRDRSEEVREHCAIVLMNLAYADENKIAMVKHKGMLDTLVFLIEDKSPHTRRYASAAMFTLACVVANTERMATHCDGEVLEALCRVLAEDPVHETRMNASEAIFNMARNNTEAVAERMASHDALLETLARAVLTDFDAEVRVFCARALEWLSADVHHPMPSHQMLLSALTAASQWTKTNCIAEAFKSQATLAENRVAMAKHNGLLEALANLALLDDLKDADVRMSSVAALELVSRDPTARRFMVQNELVMMALTRASFEQGGTAESGIDSDSKGVDGKLVKAALKNLADSM